MRFCNRCGRLYSGSKCICKSDTQKKKRNYNNQYHDTFYDSTYWQALRNAVRVRDYDSDRLAMCLFKYDSVDKLINMASYNTVEAFDLTNAYNVLRELLIDDTGEIKRNTGNLIVHHIKTRFECLERQYDMDNLITLSFDAHEAVHKMYNTHRKDAVQTILFAAVQAQLP